MKKQTGRNIFKTYETNRKHKKNKQRETRRRIICKGELLKGYQLGAKERKRNLTLQGMQAASG